MRAEKSPVTPLKERRAKSSPNAPQRLPGLATGKIRLSCEQLRCPTERQRRMKPILRLRCRRRGHHRRRCEGLPPVYIANDSVVRLNRSRQAIGNLATAMDDSDAGRKQAPADPHRLRVSGSQVSDQEITRRSGRRHHKSPRAESVPTPRPTSIYPGPLANLTFRHGFSVVTT